jgi:hypothetical protein
MGISGFGKIVFSQSILWTVSDVTAETRILPLLFDLA